MFESMEGKARKFAGRVQEAVGQVADDPATRVEGQARQLFGKAQQGYGEALHQVRESAVAHPLGTVAAIAGIGFILGAIWARR